MKKLFKIGLVSLMLLGSFATVNAKEVEPRAGYCGQCGSMSLIYLDTTVIRTTNETREVKCTHHKYGTDLQRKYETEVRYSCARCGIFRVPSYQWELEECGGYR